MLFIADEVLTGYGRTGRLFAVDHWGVVPDIITVGKALGAGYAPLGAVLANQRVLEAFIEGSGKFSGGFTYSGNPLSCLIGLLVLGYINHNDLFRRAADMGNYLHASLRALKDRQEAIGDVRGLGLLAGIEFVSNRAGREPFPRKLDLASRIALACRERGVLLRAGVADINYGAGGDHIQISPPYIISKAEIDTVIGALEEAIESAL